METKTPPTSFHHQRAPRTPESYFNVPESIALLNIVKSERIQSAFQSNRKNHASVWEMVAEILNRFGSRKRSAKQCCNRYENLKKIYTQLKKNPERHVRRNWPYMFLFKEIEENRGECWGSNSKRLTLIAKNHKNLAYFHRRRSIDDFSGLLLNNNKDTQNSSTTATTTTTTAAQHNLLQSLMLTAVASDAHNETNGNKLSNFLANNFVENQLVENAALSTSSVFSPAALQLHIATASAAAACINNSNNNNKPLDQKDIETTENNVTPLSPAPSISLHDLEIQPTNNNDKDQQHFDNKCDGFNENETKEEFLKKCQQRNHNSLGCDNNISMKSEPMSEGEFNPDDIQLMQTNYNGAQGYYANNMDHNILHPDVIVDTDNLSDCSSLTSRTMKGCKRKLSTSTDGADSTNFELIEYLKRREKRDEELLTRMDLREERLLNLLERTVVAIETLAQSSCKTFRS